MVGEERKLDKEGDDVVGLAADKPGGSGGMTCMHHAMRWTWDLTQGGAGRRYEGASDDLGSEVEMSMSVESSASVLLMRMASRGLAGQPSR